MKKILAAAVFVTALFAASNANGQDKSYFASNENVTNKTNVIYNDCNYEVWSSNNDAIIRYTNHCNCSIELKIYYRCKSYRNENINGKLTHVWSEWSDKSVVRWISANTSNGTVISGMSNEVYELIHHSYIRDTCE
ncbi:MAG: hypothetical protein LBE13_15315 [Bacteroidales bacterium]|jgi:hypothetical protein|nr:hypothetical protein [Bacteroidales bacterium]